MEQEKSISTGQDDANIKINVVGDIDPHYKRIIVSGIFGSITPRGLEAIIYSEQRIPLDVLQSEPMNFNNVTLKRNAECELIIDPIQLRLVHSWLTKKIDEYENFFGHIPTEKELQESYKKASKNN